MKLAHTHIQAQKKPRKKFIYFVVADIFLFSPSFRCAFSISLYPPFHSSIFFCPFSIASVAVVFFAAAAVAVFFVIKQNTIGLAHGRGGGRMGKRGGVACPAWLTFTFASCARSVHTVSGFSLGLVGV